MCSTWKIYSLCLMAGFMLCGEALAAGLTAGLTIDEVWMRHGGARLYYDALMEPKQMDTQGMRRKDPALMRNLPPITEMKAPPTRRRSSSAARSPKAAKPVAAQVSQSGGLPAGQATSARPSLSSTPAPQSAKVVSPAVSANGARPSSANGPGSLGGLTPTQNKDDVFVPPPAGAAPAAPAAASSSASTNSTGNGGRVAGGGQTAR